MQNQKLSYDKMDMAIIGLLAGLMTTGSQIPQAVKVYQTKDTDGLSSAFVFILFAGTLIWLLYGLSINDLPIILWNGISTITLSYIVYRKIKNGLSMNAISVRTTG